MFSMDTFHTRRVFRIKRASGFTRDGARGIDGHCQKVARAMPRLSEDSSTNSRVIKFAVCLRISPKLEAFFLTSRHYVLIYHARYFTFSFLTSPFLRSSSLGRRTETSIPRYSEVVTDHRLRRDLLNETREWAAKCYR